MSVEVHWHEGLFLQPHHLQVMQRSLLDRIAAQRSLANSYPYGVVQAKLSIDALENSLIQFERLRVVMRSGIEINVPDAGDLPSLNIRQVMASSGEAFQVLIGVPIWQFSRGNAIEPNDASPDARRLFRVIESERPDENTGDNPRSIAVRRINARLLTDRDDSSDMETLPLLRVSVATGEGGGLPRQDPAYIPPCIVLSGSVALRDMSRDLANQVEASRKELANRMGRSTFAIDNMRGAQFEQILRLRTLSRAAVRLPSVLAAPAITPMAVYLELAELYAELSALSPTQDGFGVPAYDHDNLGFVFASLSARLRGMLRGVVPDRFMKIAFTNEGPLLSAALTDEHLTRAVDYYLGIKTREDARVLASLVENQSRFHVKPRSLANQRFFGLKLNEVREPPLELPATQGLHYFHVNRNDPASARIWEHVAAERSMVTHWPEMKGSDFEIALYMVVSD